MTKTKDLPSAARDDDHNELQKYSPFFVLTKRSISVKPDFIDQTLDQFIALRNEFEITDEYPLENELIETFIRYIQERESISGAATKACIKSYTKTQNLVDEIIEELRGLSSAEEVYLNFNLPSIGSSLFDHRKQLRDLRRALKSAKSELKAKVKVGRENDFSTYNLATTVLEIFARSSNLEPKIYKSDISDSEYRGSLCQFADRILGIFKFRTKTSLHTKLYKAYRLSKSYSQEGKTNLQ